MVKILIFIFVLMLICNGLLTQEYQGCFGSNEEIQKTIWLTTAGHCVKPDDCKQLQNCTTFYGNLIFRSTIDETTVNIRIKPYFPKLREITGFLVITFYNQGTFDLLPGLSVIRGTNLIANYALVVYFNNITGIYFPSLTTILNGGVRIDQNSKLCYVDTVKWKSIVKDRDQEDKFGIVLTGNNFNCDSSCVKGQCYAAPGHSDDPTSQFCWGAGNTTGDFQCQNFCDRQCGLEGCIENTMDNCCHKECLGGCSQPANPYSCFACKHYRFHETGECVEKCPSKYYIVDDLLCKPECPGWNDPSVKPQLLLDGRCVVKCPHGYLENFKQKTCEKCADPLDCPNVCKLKPEVLNSDGGYYPGAIIRLPSDIKAKGLYGCTEVNGSITFALQEGTGNVDEVIDGLKWLRTVRGHIKIHKSSLKTMSFLENLHLIDPPEESLLLERYAVMIYENKRLEQLWTPKQRITVTRGLIFAQYNPRLCPNYIYKLQSQMFLKGTNDQIKGDISEQLNGNRVECQIERLEIDVVEVKVDNPLMYFSLPMDCILGKKCSKITWDFIRSATSRYLLFYTLYYIKLDYSHNTTTIQVIDDFNESDNWQSVDIERPDTRDNLAKVTPMSTVIKVDAFKKYAFYLKEIVSKGEGKTSKLKFLKTSQGKPTSPQSLDASYLSKDSILLQWKPPIKPNGRIVSYQIYWEKVGYSFWAAQMSVDWCKRDVKVGAAPKAQKKEEKVVPEGTCRQNFTCDCDGDKKKKEVRKTNKEEAIFVEEFQDRIIRVIFTKRKGQGGNDKDDSSLNGLSAGGKNPLVDENTTPSTFIGDVSSSEIPTVLSSNSTATDSTNSTSVVVLFDHPNGNVTGETLSFVVNGLEYFQDYVFKDLIELKLHLLWFCFDHPNGNVTGKTLSLLLASNIVFKVCACTEEEDGGECAFPATNGLNRPCATAQARTDSNPVADNLRGDINVEVDGSNYNISWLPPAYPNAIILKYQISIRFQDSVDELTLCHPGNLPTYLNRIARPGEYVARVRALSPAGNGSWSESVVFKIDEPATDQNMFILGGGVGATVLILILLAFLIYYRFFKSNVEKGAPGVLYASVNPEYMNSSEVYIPDEWELNREKIELLGELGQGSFGMVYEGIAHGISGVPELRVAVKTVNENASIRDRIEFLQEASIMKAFNSNHVVKLIGVVSQGQPTFVVMELMGRGDLKSFLRSRRPEEKSNLLPPMRAEILQMAAEIADGMAYLAARKFVHRDLAARNCMVAIDFTVKIGDFGMARDIYETDYYRKGGKGLLPVRWMSPESLRDGIFTTASDVWSYGVVLWEICTLASQPYQGKTNEEVLQFVLNDGHLIYPSDSDKQIKKFMDLCWSRDPKLRPSFLEIIRLLEDDVSEDFLVCSFYHEMKRKALEDTLCQESNLLDLLDNSKPRGKNSDLSLTSSVDSGTYIENFKPEADQTPQLNHQRKSLFVEDVSHDDQQHHDQPKNVSPTTPHIPERNCKSVYDNYGTIGDNMKYGDTPVHKSSYDGDNKTNPSRGNKDLKLSKIFAGKGMAI